MSHDITSQDVCCRLNSIHFDCAGSERFNKREDQYQLKVTSIKILGAKVFEAFPPNRMKSQIATTPTKSSKFSQVSSSPHLFLK